jgi:NitT/TauT family transport system substrate-binding protein
MTRRAAALAGAVALMAVVGCAPAAPAAPTSAPAAATAAPAAAAANLKKLTIIYGGASPNLWGVYAGMDKGFFTKYGVDVNLVTAQNSAQGVAAVIGGSADLGIASATTFMGPIAQGAKLKVLSTSYTGSPDSLLAAPSIDTPAKLKGGKIAVGALGDLSHLTAYLLVQKLGLDPDKDVTYLAIGDDAGRVAAVQSGAAQAGLINATSGTKAESEMGFHALIRGSDAQLSFPASNFGALVSTIQSQPDLIKAFFNGMLDGNNWIYDPANQQEAKAILAKVYKTTADDPSMKVAYDTTITPKAIRNPPLISADGFKTAVDFSAKFNPDLAKVDINSILDQSLLDQVVAARR